VYGTIVADVGGAGDLSIVNFVRTGPAGEESNFGVNRVNLFRVFFRRAMKDGNFIIELGPGLYELDSFTTSGWGQPVTWTAKTEARRGTRFLITRPGVYDIGTIQVTPGESQGYNVVHSMERIPRQPGQQQVLARAIEGTKWAHIAAGATNKLPAAADESQR
jgi:hypothetical protein